MRVTSLDTSVIVASIYPEHPQHAWALRQRQKAEALAMSAHSLAEVYKVIKGHPRIKLSPSQATPLLRALADQVRVIPLTEASYHAALTRCAKHQLSGSVIFDALIAQAALEAEAVALLTLNPKDFRRLGEDVAGLVVSP
ncbi:PilT protein domain protein [Deinococcus proteolyticus MRP]|uniref:Ribonuclease VapC n=2 Tax=Deinococcaceae TaxID=183710 RepID=F0RKP5_DEIPM|nr:PilT protein domain protein [Deinococcus proteolyticus MRP]